MKIRNTEEEKFPKNEASSQANKPPVKHTAKQWVLFGIAMFTVLFMFIGLSFPIWAFKEEIFGSVFERTVLGFNVLGGSMPKALESVAATLMAFVWLQLLATIVCLVLTILSITTFEQKKAQRVQIAVMIVSAAFSFLYMIDGIAAVASSELAGTTASYALFIVVALLTAGYFVCMKLLPEVFGVKKSNREARKSNGDVAEQIKKYKELYDMSAISEEEYEKKKSELLNGGK